MQSNNYGNMLKRLREYRKMLSMTEAEVANFLQVSKECYHAFEKGEKHIPCSVICKLHASGWDINYIVAGIKDKKKGALQEQLTTYGQFDEKELVLLFSWIYSNGIYLDSSMKEEQKELELLQTIAKGYENKCQKTQSLVRIVREMMNQSQEVLAEHLGVCVKTYRKIEKDIAKSRVELLGEFCALSGFRPSLFLTSSAEWDIIEHIWSVLRENEKQSILGFVQEGIKCILI